MRSVTRNLNYVDVTDFGTVGDNSTDDWPAIDQARAAAIARGAPLYFPNPDVSYRCSAPIQMVKAERWIGPGSGFKPTLTFPSSSGVLTEDLCEIRDMRIHGARDANTTGVSVVNSAARGSITRCRIQDFDVGIKTNNAWIWKFEDNLLISNLSRGILFETLSLAMTVIGGEIAGSEYGVEHQYAVNHSFYGVTIENNPTGGVLTETAGFKGGISYESCYFENSDETDVRINGTRVFNLSIQNCIFTQSVLGVDLNPGPAVTNVGPFAYLPGSEHATIKNNTFMGATAAPQDPIKVGQNAERSVIRDNSFVGFSLGVNPYDSYADDLGYATDDLSRLGGGPTGSRPTLTADRAGESMFDTTLQIPIWWNGSAWVDSTGGVV